MEWYPVYYNGLETNVEVTKCGKVRKIKVDWMKYNCKIGEVDFSNLSLNKGYYAIGVQIKGLKQKTPCVQQLIAAAFLSYKFEGNKLVVDHIDSNKQNNHLNNLRVITQRENCSKEKTIKKGLPVGVGFHKRDKKYQSYIRINGKQKYLGLFNTPEEASNAYQNKLKTI